MSNEVKTKVCKKCCVEKDIKCFYKDKGFKDGYKATCKECTNKTHSGICELCGKSFCSSKKNQKYCSTTCLSESQKKRVMINCDCCGIEFETIQCLQDNSKNHYCSNDCKHKHHSDLMRGENNPRYNSNIVKCDFCGKDILRKESKIYDRNFCDNNCYGEYRKIHYSGENHSSWDGGKVIVKCSCCGVDIERKKSEIKENNYCSQKCMGLDRIRLYSGENNSNWSGGITNISEYLRHNIQEWKYETLKEYEYKCDISGENKDIVIHHLYNFSDIVFEVFNNLGIEIKNTIIEYSVYELNCLKEECLKLHFNYGLGVCLTSELHQEFHSTYGKKNNTIEQYMKFKKDKIEENKLESVI